MPLSLDPRDKFPSTTSALGVGWLVTNCARVGTTRLEPANGFLGSRSTSALAAANRARRPGAESASTSGFTWPCVPKILASVTFPSAVAATAARSVFPSAIAFLSTSPSTVGPAARAAANVFAGSFDGYFPNPARPIPCSSESPKSVVCAARSAGSISSEARASCIPSKVSASPFAKVFGAGVCCSPSQTQSITASPGNLIACV